MGLTAVPGLRRPVWVRRSSLVGRKQTYTAGDYIKTLDDLTA
jgi:hypothetical protein